MADDDGWALEEFDYWINRWRETEEPPETLWKLVVRWLLSSLKYDPYPAKCRPAPQLGPTVWFAELPFGRDSKSIVTCTYEINSSDRVLTCRLLGELSLPIIVE